MTPKGVLARALHDERRIDFPGLSMREGVERDCEANWGRLNKPNRHVREDGGLDSEVLNSLRLLPSPLWIGIAERICVVIRDEGLLGIECVAPFLPADIPQTGVISFQPFRDISKDELRAKRNRRAWQQT